MSINISYTKQSSGKYKLLIEQSGEVLYEGLRNGGTPEQAKLTQQMYAYLQSKARKELADNPDFKWHNIKEFKSFAGSRTIAEFLAKLDAGELDES